MNYIITMALQHVRTVLLLLTFFILAGLYAYIVIPKESFPDVVVPFVVVTVKMRGISAEDAERLLVRPIEKKIQNIEGVKEVKSTAKDGYASVVLEFQAGLDIKQILSDVRKEIDIVKADLPETAEDPTVEEVNLSHFPVLTVILSGNVPDRTLFEAAEVLKEKIESLGAVLKSPIFGKRDAVVDIIVNPRDVETYGLYFGDIIKFFKNNNYSVSAGTLNEGHDGFSVKVPGLIETVNDLKNIPLKSDKLAVVTLKDIAKINPTFKKVTGVMRNQGIPSIAINVSKRTGENIIETLEKVRSIVDDESKKWHGKIHITYAHDESGKIRDMLHELQNNLILAVFLVMLVIIFSLGLRSSLLVSMAIPGAFLMGVFYLYIMGYTFNIVVLFALILSVGMLVDGAIIVVEYADRRLLSGVAPAVAYREAACRMAWPVITSILTILVVFFPLLYWPGIVGEFMKFMPITLIATLSASLLMALIFIPTLGSMFGGGNIKKQKLSEDVAAGDSDSLRNIPGITGLYVHILDRFLQYPWRIISAAVGLLCVVVVLYATFGRGVEFFPNIEPKSAAYLIRARGNLSFAEKDRLVTAVEQALLSNKSFENSYANVGVVEQAAEDVIGKVTVEFVHWKKRQSADYELNEAMKSLQHIPGIKVEIERDKPGPSKGKPLSMVVTGINLNKMSETIDKILAHMYAMPDLLDIQDNRPVPGIAWEMEVDRAQAALFNMDVKTMGHALELITDGLEVDTFRPDTSREEISIVLRYPEEYRTLEMLDHLMINDYKGNLIPIGNFVKRVPKKKMSTISRLDGQRYYQIEANVKPGVLVDGQIKALQNWLKNADIPSDVSIIFKGEEDDKKETGAFLQKAFLVAIFLILVILVTQFNSFFSAFLVLSSVVLSTFGVFVGLLIMNQAFSIVMTGLGIIALSGIIVSNNIILLDTFNHLKKRVTDLQSLRDAVLRTGAQRFRPVVLTKLTTILGLLPILFGIGIDFVNIDISIGDPSGDWWVQLSTAIVFGVLFASLLTLVVTPSALYIWERRRFR